MTKDLAINIHGNKVEPGHYVDTIKFIDVVAENLDKQLWLNNISLSLKKK